MALQKPQTLVYNMRDEPKQNMALVQPQLGMCTSSYSNFFAILHTDMTTEASQVLIWDFSKQANSLIWKPQMMTINYFCVCM